MQTFNLPDGVLETVNDAHKCKIWAFKQGYDILSGVDHEYDSDGNSKFIGYAYPCNTKSKEHLQKPLSVEIVGESEAEAIFKAVDWIIKDIKNETLS